MQKRILIVEDNPAALEMLSFILTGEGFSVITAEDGLQALDLVKTHEPDLIIAAPSRWLRLGKGNENVSIQA